MDNFRKLTIYNRDIKNEERRFKRLSKVFGGTFAGFGVAVLASAITPFSEPMTLSLLFLLAAGVESGFYFESKNNLRFLTQKRDNLAKEMYDSSYSDETTLVTNYDMGSFEPEKTNSKDIDFDNGLEMVVSEEPKILVKS